MADFRHNVTKAVRSAEPGSPEHAELAADPVWVELVDPAAPVPDAEPDSAPSPDQGEGDDEAGVDGEEPAVDPAQAGVPPEGTVTEPPESQTTTKRASRR